MYHLIAAVTNFSFLLFGNRCRLNPSFKYWFWAIFPIAIYSLGYGLRDGWGVDFNHYRDLFCNLKDTDPSFFALNYILHLLGLDYPFAFIAYSVILCLGFFFITRRYKKCAFIILPLMWCLSASSVTLIRFYVGVGWMLIAISFLLERKIVFFALFSTIAATTHTSLIFVIPFILLFWYKDFFTNKKIVLIVFVCSTFFLDKSFFGMQIVTPIVDFLDSHIHLNRLNFYASSSDIWFSGERLLDAAQNEFNERMNFIRLGITHFLILYFGFDCKDRFRYGYFFYSLTCVSCFFYNLVQGFELVIRYVLFFYLFIAFSVAFILVDQMENKRHKKVPFAIVMFFVIFNLFYKAFLGSQTFTYYIKYIWN